MSTSNIPPPDSQQPKPIQEAPIRPPRTVDKLETWKGHDVLITDGKLYRIDLSTVWNRIMRFLNLNKLLSYDTSKFTNITGLPPRTTTDTKIIQLFSRHNIRHRLLDESVVQSIKNKNYEALINPGQLVSFENLSQYIRLISSNNDMPTFLDGPYLQIVAKQMLRSDQIVDPKLLLLLKQYNSDPIKIEQKFIQKLEKKLVADIIHKATSNISIDPKDLDICIKALSQDSLKNLFKDIPPNILVNEYLPYTIFAAISAQEPLPMPSDYIKQHEQIQNKVFGHYLDKLNSIVQGNPTLNAQQHNEAIACIAKLLQVSREPYVHSLQFHINAINKFTKIAEVHFDKILTPSNVIVTRQNIDDILTILRNNTTNEGHPGSPTSYSFSLENGHVIPTKDDALSQMMYKQLVPILRPQYFNAIATNNSVQARAILDQLPTDLIEKITEGFENLVEETLKKIPPDYQRTIFLLDNIPNREIRKQTMLLSKIMDTIDNTKKSEYYIQLIKQAAAHDKTEALAHIFNNIRTPKLLHECYIGCYSDPSWAILEPLIQKQLIQIVQDNSSDGIITDAQGLRSLLDVIPKEMFCSIEWPDYKYHVSNTYFFIILDKLLNYKEEYKIKLMIQGLSKDDYLTHMLHSSIIKKPDAAPISELENLPNFAKIMARALISARIPPYNLFNGLVDYAVTSGHSKEILKNLPKTMIAVNVALSTLAEKSRISGTDEEWIPPNEVYHYYY